MSDFSIRAGAHNVAVTVQDAGGLLHVAVDGRVHRVELNQWVHPTHFVVSVDGASTPVAIERTADGLRVTLGPDQYRIEITPRLPIQRRGGTRAGTTAEVRVVAPMPGLIVAVLVGPGALIGEAAPIVVIEAMKMQMEIRAPRSGRISSISVQPGQEVAKGQTLATIASTQSTPSAPSNHQDMSETGKTG